MSPIVYDLTHLLHRVAIGAPSGIDRVDLMFARALVRSPHLVGALHYGVSRPSFVSPLELSNVVDLADRRWRRAADDDAGLREVKKFLNGFEANRLQPPAAGGLRSELLRRARIGRLKIVSARAPPRGAIYVNVAQHALERQSHFDWLKHRPDIKPVFFLHDLLPLDYPEFWPAGHQEVFERRIATLFSRARGILTSSETVADRVREELRHRGIRVPPLLARSLPSPLQANSEDRGVEDPELFATPYFVAVGTIEPRKNHLTLINAWRAMVDGGVRPPKLILVGGRGWINGETCAALDRALAVRGHIMEAAGLSDSALRTLLRNARGLLAPSFAEGYGLPLVEALELGAPVVASDIAVFREVTGGCATFVPATDGEAWRRAVMSLSSADGDAARAARQKGSNFRRINPTAYFEELQAFLQELQPTM